MQTLVFQLTIVGPPAAVALVKLVLVAHVLVLVLVAETEATVVVAVAVAVTRGRQPAETALGAPLLQTQRQWQWVRTPVLPAPKLKE